MNKILLTALMMLVVAGANAGFFGTGLCGYPQYDCIKVAPGQNWENMFPNEEKRDIVQRINRTYNPLWAGKVIAVPKNLAYVNQFDVAPFPIKIAGEDQKQVIVDQDKLAWGAYDAQGNLVKWGPISSGRDKCTDANRSCRTLTGIFRVFSKENEKCSSNVFPIGKGGAKMPYCMYFHKGFALHGSTDIPGVRASHGCVRMFIEDAKWLNHEFVELSSERNNFKGTTIIVRPINDSGTI
ncbi:MAG: L,D-transpeptidase [Legionella sp.]|nr:L,D-transpeptidase [Legionella sp.]